MAGVVFTYNWNVKFNIAFLGIGIPQTPGADVVLQHADRGVLKIGLAATGERGAIPRANASYLLGNVSRREIDQAFVRLKRQRPDFLVVAIGAHGNSNGFGASDKIYEYGRLRDQFGEVGAHATAAFINTCGAGGFAKSATVLGGIELEPTVDPLWCATLFSTAPGVRALMATGASEKTYEDHEGSWYFDDLLTAMYAPLPGDLAAGTLVSDALVMARAHQLMAMRGVHSRSEGILGDMPLMHANLAPVGEAIACARATRNLSVVVDVRIRDRRHMPTTVYVTPFVAGIRHESTRQSIVPVTDDAPMTAKVMIDLARSAPSSRQLWMSGRCDVTWRVAAYDECERCLGQWDFPASYETTSLPRQWR